MDAEQKQLPVWANGLIDQWLNRMPSGETIPSGGGIADWFHKYAPFQKNAEDIKYVWSNPETGEAYILTNQEAIHSPVDELYGIPIRPWTKRNLPNAY